MEDTLISFKTAKLAKKKGFDVPCTWFYSSTGDKNQGWLRDMKTNWNSWPITRISASTQSLLAKWLREKHDIIVQSEVFDRGFLVRAKFCYQWRIYNKSDAADKTYVSSDEWRTYEESMEFGLNTALRLIKVGKQKKSSRAS